MGPRFLVINGGVWTLGCVVTEDQGTEMFEFSIVIGVDRDLSGRKSASRHGPVAFVSGCTG